MVIYVRSSFLTIFERRRRKVMKVTDTSIIVIHHCFFYNRRRSSVFTRYTYLQLDFSKNYHFLPQSEVVKR